MKHPIDKEIYIKAETGDILENKTGFQYLHRKIETTTKTQRIFYPIFKKNMLIKLKEYDWFELSKSGLDWVDTIKEDKEYKVIDCKIKKNHKSTTVMVTIKDEKGHTRAYSSNRFKLGKIQSVKHVIKNWIENRESL